MAEKVFCLSLGLHPFKKKMKLINKNQPVKLSDGRTARILGEISNGVSLLLAVAFKSGDSAGSELVALFDHTGCPQWAGGDVLRLVNAPKQITTVTRYAFVFEDGFFLTKLAEQLSSCGRDRVRGLESRHGELVAIVPVTLTVNEGEGL